MDAPQQPYVKIAANPSSSPPRILISIKKSLSRRRPFAGSAAFKDGWHIATNAMPFGQKAR